MPTPADPAAVGTWFLFGIPSNRPNMTLEQTP